MSHTSVNISHYCQLVRKDTVSLLEKKKQQTSEFKGKKYKPKQQNYEIPPNPFYMNTHFVFRNIQTDTQHRVFCQTHAFNIYRLNFSTSFYEN